MISIYEMRGREAGHEEGILIGKRAAALGLLRSKFGALPQHTETNVQRLAEYEFDALTGRILSAQTLQELGLEAE